MKSKVDLRAHSLRTPTAASDLLATAAPRRMSDWTLLLIKSAVALAALLAVYGWQHMPRPAPGEKPETRVAFHDDFASGTGLWSCSTRLAADGGCAAVEGSRNPDGTTRLVRPGLTIRQGARYRLSLRCWTPQPGGAVVKMQVSDDGIDPDGDGQMFTCYMHGVDLYPSADDQSVYAFEFTSPRPTTTRARLALDLIGAPAFCLDDVVLTRVPVSRPKPGTELVRNGDFARGLTYWYWPRTYRSGASARYSAEDGELHVRIDEPGRELHDILFYYYPSLIMEKGKGYEIAFRARASAPRKIGVAVSENNSCDLDGDGGFGSHYGNYRVNLTTEMRSYQRVFSMPSVTDHAAFIKINLGGWREDVWIDDVSVREAPFEALRYEGSFLADRYGDGTERPLIGSISAGRGGFALTDGGAVALYRSFARRPLVRDGSYGELHADRSGGWVARDGTSGRIERLDRSLRPTGDPSPVLGAMPGVSFNRIAASADGVYAIESIPSGPIVRKYSRDLRPTSMTRGGLINDIPHGPSLAAHPTCIAVSPDGRRVAVGIELEETDRAHLGYHGVVVYSADLSRVLGVVSGDNLFGWPSGIAFDEAGRLYVVSRSHNVVLVFDSSYNLVSKSYLIRTPPGGATSAEGETGGRMRQPRSIAVRAGRVYVTESGNHRVSVFRVPPGLPR